MTASAPPGPGWTLDRDGRWRPPPFAVDTGVQAGSAGEDDADAKPPRDHSRAKAAAGRAGRMTGAAVAGLVCLIVAVAAGSSVYNGVRADEVATSPMDEHTEGRARYQGQDAVRAADVWGPVGNPDTICPTAAEVAALTGDDEPGTYAYDETTRVNGIPLFGARCNYGEHVHVGAAVTGGDVVTWLADSTGDYEISDGPLDVPSVRVVEPPDSGVEGRGAGSVRIVFQIGDRAYWVAVDTAREDQADALAQMVRTRNG